MRVRVGCVSRSWLLDVHLAPAGTPHAELHPPLAAEGGTLGDFELFQVNTRQAIPVSSGFGALRAYPPIESFVEFE